MDLLGNEVVTLSNERLSAGEQTKTFTIPNRLNSGFISFVLLQVQRLLLNVFLFSKLNTRLNSANFLHQSFYRI
ncbi:hypothetical protein CS542_05140 [Pedobacter sp. IW39]|nr:hypothetical protein CS542_05140 [Pedobacter sp. IW39]